MLPPERASAFGRGFMARLGPRLDAHSKIRRNIRRAFPEKSAQNKRILAYGAWSAFGQVLAEYPHLETLCRQEADERLEVVVKDESARWYRKEAPAVFVTAHLGNWELSGVPLGIMGVPLTAVYTPNPNPRIDAMIQGRRRALFCEMITKDAGVRELIRHLEKGRSLGLLVDQRVDSGEPVPFFGRPSLTTLVPARLALKLGLDMVPTRVERLPGGRFRVTYFDAVKPRDPEQDRYRQALDMMGQVNALFESWIRMRPSQWHCIKRRWSKLSHAT